MQPLEPFKGGKNAAWARLGKAREAIQALSRSQAALSSVIFRVGFAILASQWHKIHP